MRSSLTMGAGYDNISIMSYQDSLTLNDIAERRKFIPFTKDKDGKKVPLFGWKHPNYPMGVNGVRRVNGKGWNVSSTTPTYHLTYPECIALRSREKDDIWPAVVIGDVQVKGNANAPDAPFLVDNLYFELDGDIDPDDGSKAWQQAHAWLMRMKDVLSEVFPIYSVSVGGRGFHFPVRLAEDCSYFRNPAKFNIPSPYGYAHIEVWAPEAGARNMIWGDVWFQEGVQGKIPLQAEIPIITDEVVDHLKGFIPGNFESTLKVTLPPGIEYAPMREGAVARILNAGVLYDVREPASLNGTTRYIRTKEGRLASLWSNAGRDRYLSVQKSVDDRVCEEIIGLELPPKEMQDWLREVRRNQAIENQPRLFQSINGFLETFVDLPDDVRPHTLEIPRMVASDLNKATYKGNNLYDPILIFDDLIYQASTGKVLEPSEIEARNLTTDLVGIPYAYPSVRPEGALADLGREVYRVWTEANGKEFLILLLTRRKDGLGICQGETRRGKTTLFVMLQALGLAYITPQAGYPQLFTRTPKKQADLFAKADQALALRRCVLIEEIATAFTEANFAPHQTPPNRLEEGGLKELTTKGVIEYRNPYKEGIIAPVIASLLAVCNDAPVLFGIDEEAILRRIWGFQAPGYSSLLDANNNWETAHFTDRETLQGFLYELARDCREVIPGWNGSPPMLENLPTVVEATKDIQQAIRDQNDWYKACRNNKGKAVDLPDTGFIRNV